MLFRAFPVLGPLLPLLGGVVPRLSWWRALCVLLPVPLTGVCRRFCWGWLPLTFTDGGLCGCWSLPLLGGCPCLLFGGGPRPFLERGLFRVLFFAFPGCELGLGEVGAAFCLLRLWALWVLPPVLPI